MWYYVYKRLKLSKYFVYCMTVYMYAYNVLLTNTCNMYEIKILLLLLLLFATKKAIRIIGNSHYIAHTEPICKRLHNYVES